MPSFLWSAGTNRSAAASLTTRSPITITPLSLRSSPATIRKVVVLPQPDGPSSVTNSPSATRRSISFTAANSPNFRLTFSRTTFDIRHPIQSQGANPSLDDAELHPSENDHHGHHDETDHAHLFRAAV